ncbi:uncharacterized protein FFFS_14431 [Fusarium fujikuroi]|nr:uncharacterized protein FFFS_14431 [Fusarium fujikuroi]
MKQYKEVLGAASDEIRQYVDRAVKERKEEKQGVSEDRKVADIKVNTMYKRKGVKIHPVDDAPSDGSVLDGDPFWKEKKWAEIKDTLDTAAKYAEWITPKFSKIERGCRLKGERLSALKDQVSGTLMDAELDIFLEVMYNREAALAWDFSECGQLDPIVAPPQVLKVVPHKAWQARDIPIPKGCEAAVIRLLKERLARGVLEESHGAYRNAWFLVAKKDGNFRLINSATLMNKVTVRDGLSPPHADEFSADFAMCKIISLLDFFSGYDQFPLDEKSRDMTTFNTPMGLLRMCSLPQGATNSVAQFMRNIIRIFRDLIPEVFAPGVRRYILEHLINIDKVLLNTELLGCTIAGGKSQFCQKTTVVVGYLCGTYGRAPDNAKVIKIVEWKKCANAGEVRSFLGITGYYRQWIRHFAWIAKPLTKLLQKDIEFSWGQPEQEAMDILKEKIT